MIPKCPMCGGKNFDRARHIVRSGSIRYSFLSEAAGRLTPTSLISSLPVMGRACMDCGYVAMMISDTRKLAKLAVKDEKAFLKSEEKINENLEALEQMEADQPTAESSEVLADLDVTVEEKAALQTQAMEALAQGPAPEPAEPEGPLKDLAQAVEPDAVGPDTVGPDSVEPDSDEEGPDQ